jgi:diketogulonate reductase-like aldo/keto reductase
MENRPFFENEERERILGTSAHAESLAALATDCLNAGMTPRPVPRRDALRLLAGGALALGASRGMLAADMAATQQPDILTRPIPISGEALPVIGLGTWQTFDVGPGAAERGPLVEVLREFAARGGKVIDSSPMYGRSEEVAGDLIAQLGLREKFFVATKVWTSGAREGIAQMNDSLRKLRADPIDLLQVHNLLDVRTHLDTLRGWKRDGRVRYLGVTHYTAAGAEAVARLIANETVDFVQINYSVGEREAEQRLLPLARERKVAVIANRPFGGGELLRGLRNKRLPGWAREIGCASWAQALLKFVISHPALTCAIPGTSKVEHLRDNLQAGVGALPDEKLREQIAADAR